MRSSPGPSRTGKPAGAAGGGGARAGGGTRRPSRAAGARPAELDAAGFDAWLGGAEPLPRALYLGGADEAAKAEALARLRERWAAVYPDIPPTVLRAGEAGIEQVMAAAQGGSLFQPAAFVLVLNVEEWVRSPRTVEAAAQGTAAIAPENCVVFVESAAETERKTLAALAGACGLRVALDGLPPEVLARWAERRLARLGVKAEPGVLERVIDASRLETAEVMNEVAKLADWAGPGARVTRAQAEEVLRPVHSGSLAALARAVAERHADQAVDHLLRSLGAGESEGTALFQLQTLFAGALRLKTQQWGWIRDRENSERLARGASERELTAALDLLYRVERAWKSGRGDAATLLTRAVIGVAGGDGGPPRR
jgi:DNA polymerase III delta subunit